MNRCQRCGVERNYSGAVTLNGGVKAELCPGCVTEWDAHFYDMAHYPDVEAYDACEDHYDSLAKAGKPPTEADWLALAAERSRLHRLTHAAGREFVKPIRGATPTPE